MNTWSNLSSRLEHTLNNWKCNARVFSKGANFNMFYFCMFCLGYPQRLPFHAVNWLSQLYSINPYPDRFQMGTMALHCNIEGLRVRVICFKTKFLFLYCWAFLSFRHQNWFQNRRARDWRTGTLCRQCRYFKNSLVTEEMHRRDPYSRHCVTMSIPQTFLQQLVLQQSTLINAPTSSTSNNVSNINLPATSGFIPFHAAPHSIQQHQFHNLNNFQQQEEQRQEQTRSMPHPPYSLSMVFLKERSIVVSLKLLNFLLIHSSKKIGWRRMFATVLPTFRKLAWMRFRTPFCLAADVKLARQSHISLPLAKAHQGFQLRGCLTIHILPGSIVSK